MLSLTLSWSCKTLECQLYNQVLITRDDFPLQWRNTKHDKDYQPQMQRSLTEYLANQKSNRAICHLWFQLTNGQEHLPASFVLDNGATDWIYLSVDALAEFKKNSLLSNVVADVTGRPCVYQRPIQKFVPVNDTRYPFNLETALLRLLVSSQSHPEPSRS